MQIWGRMWVDLGRVGGIRAVIDVVGFASDARWQLREWLSRYWTQRCKSTGVRECALTSPWPACGLGLAPSGLRMDRMKCI